MNESSKQIVIAVAASAAAAATAAIITHYLTKSSTLTSVANGSTPLPAGATPTTNGPPIVAKPTATPSPPPAPPPAPTPKSDLQSAAAIAQGANVIQGYMGPSWSNASP